MQIGKQCIPWSSAGAWGNGWPGSTLLAYKIIHVLRIWWVSNMIDRILQWNGNLTSLLFQHICFSIIFQVVFDIFLLLFVCHSKKCESSCWIYEKFLFFLYHFNFKSKNDNSFNDKNNFFSPKLHFFNTEVWFEFNNLLNTYIVQQILTNSNK